MLSQTHTARVAEAFDSVAERFEATLENNITRGIRSKLYTLIDSLVPRGSEILDINCGIGIDAVELARNPVLRKFSTRWKKEQLSSRFMKQRLC